MWENITSILKENFEWVLGIFVSLVTILGSWIGILQYKLNKVAFRRESFDKNFKYYSMCEDFIFKILYGWITIEECTEFQKSMKEVEYLFNDKVNGFIDKILAISYQLAQLNENIKVYQGNESILTNVNKDERKKLMREKTELLKKVEPSREELKTVFSKYLKVK